MAFGLFIRPTDEIPAAIPPYGISQPHCAFILGILAKTCCQSRPFVASCESVFTVDEKDGHCGPLSNAFREAYFEGRYVYLRICQKGTSLHSRLMTEKALEGAFGTSSVNVDLFCRDNVG